MPRYDFRCETCGKAIELILPIVERNDPRACLKCRGPLARQISLPQPAIIPATGTDKVLANLNARDDGHGNYPHHKEAMWKGLHQRSPVVGRGFG